MILICDHQQGGRKRRPNQRRWPERGKERFAVGGPPGFGNRIRLKFLLCRGHEGSRGAEIDRTFLAIEEMLLKVVAFSWSQFIQKILLYCCELCSLVMVHISQGLIVSLMQP